MSTPVPSFRGVALAGTLRAARALDGEAVEDILREHASAALRAAITDISSRAWYPAPLYLELLDLVFRHVAMGDPSIHAQLACDAVLGDLRGIYRVLLRVVSPAYVISRADRFFGSYVNYGRVTILERTAFSAQIVFELDPSNEAFWVSTAGGVRGALEAAGAAHVRVSSETDETGRRCVYSVQWG